MIYLNTALLVIVTSLTVYLVYRWRSKLTDMEGMVVAMAVSTATSTILGLHAAFLLHKDMADSTIVAVVIGMITGFFLGRPIHALASIEGMVAGIMGGMMGAMLGVMLHVPEPMVLFFDAVLTVVLITVLFAVGKKEQAGRRKELRKMT